MVGSLLALWWGLAGVGWRVLKARAGLVWSLGVKFTEVKQRWAGVKCIGTRTIYRGGYGGW